MPPIKGKGTQLHVSISSVFTKISNVINVGPGEEGQGIIDWTELDSDSVRRIGTAVSDGGELTFKFNWDPTSTTQQYLQAAARTSDPEDFKLIVPEAVALEEPFSAVVTKFGRDEINNQTQYLGNITLAIDGLRTYPDGGS